MNLLVEIYNGKNNINYLLTSNYISHIRCHYDFFTLNLLTGVTAHPKEGEIILNDAYEELAIHYKTAILPAGVRKPKQKPTVEGVVGDVATAIIARLRNTTFTSLASLKQAVKEKLAEYNTEEFQKREKSRYLCFTEEELPRLNPLPKYPYEASTWYYNRKVQLNSHVAFKKNFYSCPHAYLGKKVDLKVMTSRIEIFHNGERIKTHQVFGPYAKNKYRTDQEDMPKDGQFQEWSMERILAWACEIGNNTTVIVQRVFDSVEVKEQGFNPALSILRLGRKYTYERLEIACQIALKQGFGSPRYAHLNSILSSNQDQIYLEDLETKQKESNQPTLFTRGADYYSNFGKGGNQ